MKLKKRKKASRMRGKSTHGHGARKKWKKSGHRGGCGMAGTGKRGDQKKSLIIKLYGNKYFGKQGITSKRTKKKKINVINLRDIKKKYFDKKEINLKDYKILGDGEITKAITITAKSFTKSAKDKIEKAGGKAFSIKIKQKPKSEASKNTSENKSNSSDKKQEIINKKEKKAEDNKNGI